MASCVILGHTGAVGKSLLKLVMGDARFAKVTVVGRREIDYEGPNKGKLNQQVVDFEKLSEHRSVFKGYDVAFCSLGTTRADAASAEAFRRIDHDYVVESAKLIHEENLGRTEAEANKSIHFLYVSAKSADANSMFLYPKTKGEIENDLKDIGFRRMSIFRPGLLEIEETREGHSRFGENLALAILPFFKFFSPTGISCPVSSVAKAMVRAFTEPNLQEPATRLFLNAEICELGKSS